MKIRVTVLRELDFEIEFPFYRSRLIGEYGVGRYEKTYWKFEYNYRHNVWELKI